MMSDYCIEKAFILSSVAAILRSKGCVGLAELDSKLRHKMLEACLPVRVPQYLR